MTAGCGNNPVNCIVTVFANSPQFMGLLGLRVISYLDIASVFVEEILYLTMRHAALEVNSVWIPLYSVLPGWVANTS